MMTKQLLLFQNWKLINNTVYFKKLDENTTHVFERLIQIKFLIDPKVKSKLSYKFLRRQNGFPCRGQRTRSNAKIAKKRLWFKRF